MSIAIVTDSTADLPLEYLQAYNVQVIPAMVILNGKTFADGEGLSRAEFYANMSARGQLLTTAAPPVTMFSDLYERLLRESASQVVSIHVSSAFSGVYNIACAAAQSFRDKVQVFDSEQISFGLGFQVLAAAEAAAAGASLEEIHRIVERVSQNVHFLALLDTLEYVRRSGRVHWTAAAVGNLLNLKAMIEVKKGEVLRSGLFRNRRQGIASLIKRLCDLGPLDRLALVYTQLSDPEEINHILESVKSQLLHPAIISQVTTVIGTHVGPDGIGFIAVTA